MSKPRVFIDGEHGTTGLEIRARLAERSDLELVSLPREKAKDESAKREVINTVDAVILCLPDEAARATAAMIANPRTAVIDASTAHRTASGWVYGFPELTRTQRATIGASKRISNPGCYPTGFLALARPLREAAVMASTHALSVHAVSGYSGGGKKLIDSYEHPHDRAPQPFGAYGLSLSHKHLPEMQLHGMLDAAPMFAPAVGTYFRGMLVQVPLHLASLAKRVNGAELHAIYAAHFADEPFVTVRPLNDMGALRDGQFLEPEDLNGTNRLEVFVYANQEQALLVARLDNLGKGASGAAVQNMNLVLGLPEAVGLT